MKNIKQLIFILAISTMLICTLSVSAAAAMTVSTGDVEAYAGEIVTVPVKVSGNAGFVSASIYVEYDASVLSLTAVNDASLIEGASHTTRFSSPYILSWENDIRTSDYIADGKLAELVFTISSSAEPGDYDITLSIPIHGILNSDGSEVDCSVATGTVTVFADVCSHEWGDWKKSSNTRHKRSCDLCGEVEYDSHEWDDGEVTKEPTEISDGIMTYTCDVCSGTKTSIIPALAHTHKWTDEYSKDETYHWYECSGCDEQNEKAEHIWDDGVETVSATETDVGVMTYTCRSCNQIKTEEIPILEPQKYEITGTVTAYGDTEEVVTITIYDAEGSSIASDSTTDGIYSFSVPDGIYP